MTTARALLIAFFGGLAPIVVLRVVFPGVGGTVAATVIAVAAIVLLGLYYHRDSQLMDRQLAGDNLYYLGLLFTLASLIIALSQLFLFNGEGREEGSVDGRAYDLIGNFGIALFSTVVGILGRILLQGAGEEHAARRVAPAPTSSEASDTRHAPAAGPFADVEALRLALRQATDAFSHFTRMTTNQTEQTIRHTERLIRTFNTEMTAAASLGLREAAGAWQETSRAMQADAKRLAGRFDDLIADFNKRIAEAAQSGIEEAAAAWQDTSQSALADNERMSQRLKGDLAEIATRTEVAHKTLRELADAVTLSARRMTAETAELASMVENAASASRGMSDFSGSMEVAQRGLDGLAQRAAEAAAGLAGSAAEIVDAHRAFAQGAKNHRETALREYKDAVSEFAESAHEGLVRDSGKWVAAVQEFAADGRKQQELGARSVEAAQRWGRQMSGEVDEWTSLAEHTRKALAEVVDRLTDTVHKS